MLIGEPLVGQDHLVGDCRTPGSEPSKIVLNNQPCTSLMITALIIMEGGWHLQTTCHDGRRLLGIDVTPPQWPAGIFKVIDDQRRVGNFHMSVGRQPTAKTL